MFNEGCPVYVVEIGVVGAKLNVCVLFAVVDELDVIVSLMTLILFQEPDLSEYWYCFPGFEFQILTLFTYIVHGWVGGKGVSPPAHSTVPELVSGSPPSQRLRLIFIGVCGYLEPFPSASAALRVRMILPSMDQTRAVGDQSTAYVWKVACGEVTDSVVERLYVPVYPLPK